MAEVADIVDVAGIPDVEGLLMHGAGHAVLIEIGCDGHAGKAQPAQHQRMDVARNRIRERRQINSTRERSRLMMRVKYQRLRLERGLGHHLRFDHVQHVAIPIVIVTHVFLP